MRFDPSGEDHKICVDTGCSTIVVDKKWLQEYAPDVKIEKVDPREMKAVGHVLKVDEKATFHIYIP
jgi:hypothetical protein